MADCSGCFLVNDSFDSCVHRHPSLFGKVQSQVSLTSYSTFACFRLLFLWFLCYHCRLLVVYAGLNVVPTVMCIRFVAKLHYISLRSHK